MKVDIDKMSIESLKEIVKAKQQKENNKPKIEYINLEDSTDEWSITHLDSSDKFIGESNKYKYYLFVNIFGTPLLTRVKK